MENMISNTANSIPEVMAFDETKASVEELVDSSGPTKVPISFPEAALKKSSVETNGTKLQVPIIDLEGFESRRRLEVVNEIRKASEGWGFFQVVNHGIPIEVMAEMLAGVKRFHEQPQKAKMEFCSSDPAQRVTFACGHLLTTTEDPAYWKDTMLFVFKDGKLDAKHFPEILREEVSEYYKHIIILRKELSELLSEALGLRSDYLSSIECMETQGLTCYKYQASSELELMRGTTEHADPCFLTILLQDNIGGLQVHYQNQWIDVPPLQGAFIVNIGSMMQLITNDRFKGAVHRVVLQQDRPRISVGCFFLPSTTRRIKPYGAINELLSVDNPPIYKDFYVNEFSDYYKSKSEGKNRSSTLDHYKLA